MGVQDPLKVVLVNYPRDTEEELEGINNPEDDSMGTRLLPFSREIYIERDDFREDPPKKYFRLAPGREVRLRYAYFITCVDVIKDENGEVAELHCTYDPQSRGGSSPDGRKVKGTLHWVSARHCLEAEFRLYDRLFTKADPTAEEKKGVDFVQYINPDSLSVVSGCKVEPALKGIDSGTRFQFERKGYFCPNGDSEQEPLVFNKAVALKDTWAKIEKREQQGG
jgi:glutaminyl-tRNA synthetase